MIEKLKGTRLGKFLKRSTFCNFVRQSHGDWRYPFIAFGWGFAKMVVPRRKVSVDGVNFNLSCTNWITHFRWYLFEKKDTEVRRYINDYVRDGDVFFDIGANVGVFSIYCAKRFKNAAIYSFEPEYSNLYLLKENVIYNALQSQVNIYSVAISDFVGMSRLNLQDVTPGSAVHTESKDSIALTDDGYPVIWAEGVTCVTVDYLCEQLDVFPNVIKIDTDGNEDKILKGAKKTLANKDLRSLIIEMPYYDRQKYDCCVEILKSSGLSLDWSDRDKTRNEVWIRKE